MQQEKIENNNLYKAFIIQIKCFRYVGLPYIFIAYIEHIQQFQLYIQRYTK